MTQAVLWRFLFGTVVLATAPVHAEILTDGSVGPKASLSGSDMRIGSELGAMRGSNLFHSFQRFDIQSGERATFTGPDQIQNVISRVTGGKGSTIDGQLRSEVGQANVFLINPAGVVFGPNAEVDVPAAFHASTADELRFSDGKVYSATNPSGSSLSMATPESFGFLSPQPASLSVNGSRLSFKPGQSATLSGGDVTIAGAGSERRAMITTEGGAIRVEAVGFGGGQVPVAHPSETPGGGRFSIEHAYLDVSGGMGSETIDILAKRIDLIDSLIVADHWGDEDSSGGIRLTASQIQVTDTDVKARVYGAGRGGNIVVDTNDLIVDAATAANGASRLATFVMSPASGTAGDVQVDAERVTLASGGQLISSFVGDGSGGSGGSVFLQADEEIIIDGSNVSGYFSGILTTVFSPSAASGGAILIDSPNASLEMSGGGRVQSGTLGSGQSGEIRIEARNVEIGPESTIDSHTLGEGHGGAIQINAKESVRVSQGYIWTDTLGSGNAGSIVIAAPIVELNGGSISANTSALGQAGEIRLAVPEAVILTDGASLQAMSSGSYDGSNLRLGAAGSVRIETGMLSMLDSSIDVPSYNWANAGSIQVFADRIHADNSISGDAAYARGDSFSAGNFAASSLIIDPGFVPATQGRSGSILLNASEILLDHGANASIYTDAGDGGTVVMRADTLSLLDGSKIRSFTSGPGRGGDVDIQVAGTFLIQGSDYDSSAFTGVLSSPLTLPLLGLPLETGPGGTIAIAAGTLVVGRKAFIQSTSFSNAAAGSISLDVGVLEVRDGGEISSSAGAQGVAAAISIRASEQVRVQGLDPLFPTDASQISSDASFSLDGGGGAGGSIWIETPRLLLDEGGQITSETSGNGGDAGLIDLRVGRLALSTGARIFSSTFGSGKAGRIRVYANSIAIDGLDAGSYSSPGTGIFGSTHLDGTGDAGSIDLEVAERLDLRNGATISTSTAGSGDAGSIEIAAAVMAIDGRTPGQALSNIQSQARESSTGLAGDIDISVNVLSIQGGEISVTADQYLSDRQTDSETHGHIHIAAHELHLDRQGSVTARSSGNVPAGSIEIEGGDILIEYQGQITTESNDADGGAIRISGNRLWLRDGSITSSVDGLTGDGGDIALTNQYLILDGGFIQANTAATGAHGGDILVDSRALIASYESLEVGGTDRQSFTTGIGRNIIQAAAPGGEQGTISLTAPDLDIASSLVPLAIPFGQRDDLILDACSAVRGTETSSLVESGLGGIAPSVAAPMAVPLGGARLERIISD